MNPASIIMLGLALWGDLHPDQHKKTVKDITGYDPPQRDARKDDAVKEPPFRGPKSGKSRKARKRQRSKTQKRERLLRNDHRVQGRAMQAVRVTHEARVDERHAGDRGPYELQTARGASGRSGTQHVGDQALRNTPHTIIHERSRMSTTPEDTTPEPEEGPFTAHYHNVRFEGFSFWSGKSQKEARNHAVRLNTMTAKYRLRIRELEAALEVRESQLQLARESRQELLDHIRFITHPITADIARRAREQAPTGDAPSDEEASPVVVNEPSVAEASPVVAEASPVVAEASPVVAEASPVVVNEPSIPDRKQHWWIKIRKKEDRYATSSYQVRKRPEWHDRVISFMHERDKCKYHFSADVYEITVSHFYDDECGLPNKRNEWDYTTTSD